MKLLERFRAQPEWQSDDPLVRAAAVRDLPDEEETRDVLLDIATNDTHPDVRCQAVARINDIDALVSIYRSDDSGLVKQEAAAGIRDLAIDSPDGDVGIRGVDALSDERDLVAVAREARIATVGRAALTRLTSARALSVVARRAALPDIAQEALARLDDPDELQSVAVKSEDRAIALGAFERLTAGDVAADVIEQIARRARQKVVQRRAKASLPSPDGPTDGLVAETRTRDDSAHVALCVAVEKIATHQEEDLKDGRRSLEEVVRQWSDLDLDPNEALATRFAVGREKASAHLTALDAAYTARQRAAGQAADDVSRVKQDRVAQTLSRLEQLAVEMDNLINDETILGDGWTTAEQKWRTLWEGIPTADALSPDQQAAVASLSERAAALEVRRRALLERSRAEKEEAGAKNLRRLQQRVKTAEGLVRSEKLNLVEAERQLRAFRRLQDDPGPLPKGERDAIVVSMKQAHAGLAGRVRELREFSDWQRWANLGIQEQLCVRMEALSSLPERSERPSVTEKAEIPEESRTEDDAAGPSDGPDPEMDAKFLEQFEELMASWRQAADVPKDQGAELWERFKAACDVVYPRYERCQGSAAAARDKNLTRQKEIVEEVETLASSSDWLKTVRRITELQAEWKTLAASPGKAQRALWRRFRAGCNEFFTRRKADLASRKKEWSVNLELKEALCVRVEGLAGTEDLPAAIAEAKRAQAEWKTVGPVRRGRADAIWQRFRAASDAVFDRLHQGEREAAAERVAIREALCVELEALVGPDGKHSPDEKQSQSEDGGDAPGATDDTPAASGSDSPTDDAARAGDEGPEVSSVTAEPAARSAPVASPGTAQDEVGTGATIAETVSDLQKRWREAPEVPQSVGRQLTGRFGTALSRLVQSHPEAFIGTDLDPARILKRLEKMCVRIESLEPSGAVVEEQLSPAERLASKWRDALASNTMGAHGNDEAKKRVAAEDVRRAKQDVSRLGPLSGESGRELMARFDAACQRVLKWAGPAGRPPPSRQQKSSKPRRHEGRPSGRKPPSRPVPREPEAAKG